MIKKRICGNKLINMILFFEIIFLLFLHKKDFEYSIISDKRHGPDQEYNIKSTSIENETDSSSYVKTPAGTKASSFVKPPADMMADREKNKTSIEAKEKTDFSSENTIIAKKQHLTLNSLATGFHTYADNKIAAKKNMHEQSITEQRFLEKIVSCIQTLFFINKPTLISHINKEKTVDILLEIKRNGFLNGIIVSKTSGDQSFDTFMKNLIEEGAKSFPPIPQLITKIPYYLVIRISCEYGISLQLLVPR